jgi:hypothetical protein
MAGYKDIQARVRTESLFIPKTCWIADVMNEHGLTRRIAPNRLNPNLRTNPCPSEKKKAIEAALRYFHMIG